MNCEFEESLGWDRTFLNLASKMAEPFCQAFGYVRFRLIAPLDPATFEHKETLTQELATRSLIGLGTLFGAYALVVMPVPMLFGAASLGLGSKFLRWIAFSLQQNNFTHVRGEAPEKALQDSSLKLMSWNVCGPGGKMSIDHGGVIDWKERVAQIVEKIRSEDPDVIVLQEIYDTDLGEALIEALKSDYAHFFMHLGANVWGSVGGVMVISKCAVHRFDNTSFETNRWTLNRTFAALEVKANPEDQAPWARIIGTHLIHGDAEIDRINRQMQIDQIRKSVAEQDSAIPTVIAGDFNIERDQEEGKILSFLEHGYVGSEPTCTNRLVAQWDLKKKSVWGETIDYISLFKPTGMEQTALKIEDCHLVKAFDETYNTKTALSDHHGLAAILKK